MLSRKFVLLATLAVIAGVTLALLTGRKGAKHAAADTAPVAQSEQGSGSRSRLPEASARSVPSLVTVATPSRPKAIENDPRAPGYDAVKLQEMTGTPLQSIFQAEPKNQAWATKVEATMTKVFDKDFTAVGIAAHVRGVDCRTRVCEVTLEGDTKEALNKAHLLIQYTPMANVLQPGRDLEGEGHARTFLLAFGGDEEKVRRWNESYPRRRAEHLAWQRERGLPSHFPPVPPDE
jgi:hypothetical protein